MRFLTVVFLIWGAMHLYAWARVRAYTGLGPPWAVVLAAALVVLMVAPIAGMSLSRAGRVLPGRLLSVVGMVWAGAFFLFFCVSLAHDAYNGLLSAAGLLIPAAKSARLVGAWPLAADVILVASATVSALFAAWHVTPHHIQMKTPELPSDLPRVRIVQISDVHLGATVGKGRLSRILEVARAAKPDLFISTGDLVDAERGDMTDLAEMLASIQAPLGKYATTGNHEYYAGLDQSLAFTRKSGFTMLSNELARVRPGLTLAGFDDETARFYRGERKQWDEAAIVSQATKGDYVVVLKHRPFVLPQSRPFWDLQLSGHTHGGQIFPFTLVVLAFYEYPPGLVGLEADKFLFTSRGAGTWGPPMRFVSSPEVTVVDIVRSAEQGRRGRTRPGPG